MRCRLVAVLVSAGVALVALPAAAAPPLREAGGVPGAEAPAAEQQALDLLRRAAWAGQRVGYTGTQYLASWRTGQSGSVVVDVTHAADGQAVMSPTPLTATPLTATASLDPRLLDVLAASYDLVVTAPGRCTGRDAHVVEARRTGGTVAGRFWLDRDSGLLLRREVFDEGGQRLRSSAFLDLSLTGPTGTAGDPGAAGTASTATGTAAVPGLRARGWTVPESLPAGFRLLDASEATRSGDAQVLHLAYTDGLSTLALFAQQGRLGTSPPTGFAAARVGGRPVWVRDDGPGRVVWSGGGRVWTLVSDAAPPAVTSAVEALPRDPAPSDGVGARLARGMHRLAGMLDPFD